MTSVLAIIPAAGQGLRMGAGQRKQYLTLCDQPILSRTVAVFEQHDLIDGYLVVAPQDQLSRTRRLMRKLEPQKLIGITTGGATRQESVWKGLQSLGWHMRRKLQTGVADPIVLVHDGVRCLLNPRLITSCIELIRDGNCGAGAAIPIRDTIRRTDDRGFIRETPDRSNLVAMQTPQGAHFLILKQAYQIALQQEQLVTDELSALEQVGYPVRLFPGDAFNLKITTPDDLKLAEILLGAGIIDGSFTNVPKT